jgi:HSP20 family protein
MLDGPMVSISAGRRQEKEMIKGERIVRSERYNGKVSRSFHVGAEAEESKANAKCADGVLALTLAKKITSAAKRLVID